LASIEARGTGQQRLHEQAREAAVRDALRAVATPAPVEAPAPVAQNQVAAAIGAAAAALPPELAAGGAGRGGPRPERAVQAINEISEALRAVELMARTSAAGGALEPARGPRVMLPAGLGGLAAMVERTTAPRARMPMRMPALAMPMHAPASTLTA